MTNSQLVLLLVILIFVTSTTFLQLYLKEKSKMLAEINRAKDFLFIIEMALFFKYLSTLLKDNSNIFIMRISTCLVLIKVNRSATSLNNDSLFELVQNKIDKVGGIKYNKHAIKNDYVMFVKVANNESFEELNVQLKTIPLKLKIIL